MSTNLCSLYIACQEQVCVAYLFGSAAYCLPVASASAVANPACVGVLKQVFACWHVSLSHGLDRVVWCSPLE